MASNVPLVAGAWDSNVFAHLGFRLARGEIFVEMIFACEIVCRVIILDHSSSYLNVSSSYLNLRLVDKTGERTMMT